MNPSGVLVIDKPAKMTSHDVVDAVRRLLETAKVGHSGTLDPDATGVLIVGVGKATRLMAFLQNLPKTYEAQVRFGVSTDTQDASGSVISQAPCTFDSATLVTAASEFVGEISQLPPMVSAVKVGGEPLYKAARRGEEVERKTRRVRIYDLDISGFDGEKYTAEMKLTCSSGTFVRTLAHDLGERLGCGAHVTRLARTSVGKFSIDQAVSLEALSDLSPDERLDLMLSPAVAMESFPTVIATSEVRMDVMHGRPLLSNVTQATPGELPVASSRSSSDRPPHEVGTQAGMPVAIVDEDGQLLAVYRKTSKGLRAAAVLEAG